MKILGNTGPLPTFQIPYKRVFWKVLKNTAKYEMFGFWTPPPSLSHASYSGCQAGIGTVNPEWEPKGFHLGKISREMPIFAVFLKEKGSLFWVCVYIVIEKENPDTQDLPKKVPSRIHSLLKVATFGPKENMLLPSKKVSTWKALFEVSTIRYYTIYVALAKLHYTTLILCCITMLFYTKLHSSFLVHSSIHYTCYTITIPYYTVQYTTLYTLLFFGYYTA